MGRGSQNMVDPVGVSGGLAAHTPGLRPLGCPTPALPITSLETMAIPDLDGGWGPVRQDFSIGTVKTSARGFVDASRVGGEARVHG